MTKSEKISEIIETLKFLSGRTMPEDFNPGIVAETGANSFHAPEPSILDSEQRAATH